MACSTGSKNSCFSLRHIIKGTCKILVLKGPICIYNYIHILYVIEEADLNCNNLQFKLYIYKYSIFLTLYNHYWCKQSNCSEKHIRLSITLCIKRRVYQCGCNGRLILVFWLLFCLDLDHGLCFKS